MKRMLLLLLLSALLTSQTFATSIPLNHKDMNQLVVGRQYDSHKYFWKPASVGENNSNYADVIERFAASIGATVSYRFFSERDELFTALLEGEVDLTIGYAKSIDGERYFNYSQPIFDIRPVTWFFSEDLKSKPMNVLRWGCVHIFNVL